MVTTELLAVDGLGPAYLKVGLCSWTFTRESKVSRASEDGSVPALLSLSTGVLLLPRSYGPMVVPCCIAVLLAKLPVLRGVVIGRQMMVVVQEGCLVTLPLGSLGTNEAGCLRDWTKCALVQRTASLSLKNATLHITRLRLSASELRLNLQYGVNVVAASAPVSLLLFPLITEAWRLVRVGRQAGLSRPVPVRETMARSPSGHPLPRIHLTTNLVESVEVAQPLHQFLSEIHVC